MPVPFTNPFHHFNICYTLSFVRDSDDRGGKVRLSLSVHHLFILLLFLSFPRPGHRCQNDWILTVPNLQNHVKKSPLIFSALEMTVVNYKTWACFSMEKKNHTELIRKLWFYLFFWEILWKGVIIILEIMSYKNVWASRHPNPSRFLLSWSAAKSEEQIPFMMYVTYEKKIFF